MTDNVEVKCINKSNRFDPHERISTLVVPIRTAHVGRWVKPMPSQVSRAESGRSMWHGVCVLYESLQPADSGTSTSRPRRMANNPTICSTCQNALDRHSLGTLQQGW